MSESQMPRTSSPRHPIAVEAPTLELDACAVFAIGNEITYLNANTNELWVKRPKRNPVTVFPQLVIVREALVQIFVLLAFGHPFPHRAAVQQFGLVAPVESVGHHKIRDGHAIARDELSPLHVLL